MSSRVGKKELKLAAERHLGQPVKGAVITVPAHFNNQQRQATKDAGRIAGLDVKRIINEPTAAALSYGLHSKREKGESDGGADGGKANVVIFDLGGGTFDVSVLAMDSGVFEVKATGGDTHLGGEDFDNSVMEWCMARIKDKSGAAHDEVAKSARAQSRLRRAVENCKRALSSGTSAEIEVDSLVEDFDFGVALDRAKFEELNGALFRRCIDTVQEVLDDAGCRAEDVTDVVLVGGSTRIPCLQKSLYDMFGGRIELCKSVHPDEAVAHGAAVQGRILATGGTGGGKDLAGAEAMTDLLLLDVTPLSLGIELEGKQMSTLIKRNTPIPCKKTRTYTTVDDWQTVSRPRRRRFDRYAFQRRRAGLPRGTLVRERKKSRLRDPPAGRRGFETEPGRSSWCVNAWRHLGGVSSWLHREGACASRDVAPIPRCVNAPLEKLLDACRREAIPSALGFCWGYPKTRRSPVSCLGVPLEVKW